MSEAYGVRRQPERAETMARQALDLGERLEDPELCYHACGGLGLARFNGLHAEEAIERSSTIVPFSA